MSIQPKPQPYIDENGFPRWTATDVVWPVPLDEPDFSGDRLLEDIGERNQFGEVIV
jgi:hypothetical protein